MRAMGRPAIPLGEKSRSAPQPYLFQVRRLERSLCSVMVDYGAGTLGAKKAKN